MNEVNEASPATSGSDLERLVSRKLSSTQMKLLKECAEYNISDYCGSYYRLGGHGYAPIRYNRMTMVVLLKQGLVEYSGYWHATATGRQLVANMIYTPTVVHNSD